MYFFKALFFLLYSPRNFQVGSTFPSTSTLRDGQPLSVRGRHSSVDQKISPTQNKTFTRSKKYPSER